MLERLLAYYKVAKGFAARGHIPVWRQTVEMGITLLLRGIGPGHYLVGRFGRPEMAFKDKLQFYNGRAYVKRVLEINDRLFCKISQHKVTEAAVLNYFSIPTPESYGYFQRDVGQRCDGKPLRTSADLDSMLASAGISRFVMKPVEGYEGRGFVAAKRDAEGRITPLNAADPLAIELFAERLLTDQAGYLVQSYFSQHPELAELNPSSVNTVRMIVYRPTHKAPVCLGAFLRMGRQGGLIDNVSAGGIMANVDIDTGQVGEGYFFYPSLDLFDQHPDTGATIRGKKLPFWNEAKELSSRALLAFPNMRLVGLDIAFGPAGPTIIELNVQPDYECFALLRIPSRLALSDAYYD